MKIKTFIIAIIVLTNLQCQAQNKKDSVYCTDFNHSQWHFCLLARIHDDDVIAHENEHDADVHQLVKNHNNVTGETFVNTTSLAAGSYTVRLVSSNGKVHDSKTLILQ